MGQAHPAAAGVVHAGGPVTLGPPATGGVALDAPARLSSPVADPPHLGGRIRAEPEDFFVEEIPLYRPAGQGSQVLFQVEKRDISTFDVLLRVSKALKVSEHTVGYAGLKDAKAVTRQHLTVPRCTPERVRGIRHPRFRVLTAAAHDRPLKIGHLAGNRFCIRIRDVDPARVDAARARLERLVREGMPNAYGRQRFGARQDGHLIGRAVVDEDWPGFLDRLLGGPSRLERDPRVHAAREAYEAGDLDAAFERFPLQHRTEKKALAAIRRGAAPREVYQALGRRAGRIWIAAWQSYAFNRVLDARVAEGTWGRLLQGDVAWLAASSACYVVTDEASEAARAARLEASPTGPLVGYDLRPARGRPGEIERAVFREAGMEPEAFRAGHVRARGSRRPLRIPVREAWIEREAERVVVAHFTLPPGCFATAVLAHLM